MAVEPPVPCTPKAKLSYLLRVGRRRLDAHLRPVGVELVGENGGDAGVRPLPELDVLGDHRDGVVGRDADEGVGDELGRRASAPSARSASGMWKPTTRPTAAEPLRNWRRLAETGMFMAQPSIRPAASWMAALMR